MAEAIASSRVSSSSHFFEGEETMSDYGYGQDYKKKSIDDQVKILKGFFPKLSFDGLGIPMKGKPSLAEHWFVIPKWESIAGTYGEAVRIMHDKLYEARLGRFKNLLEGKMGHINLCESPTTQSCMQNLFNQQNRKDNALLPAQFGMLHRGKSPRNADEQMLRNSEFGLGAFTLGAMLLTHPERLGEVSNLIPVCLGDHFNSNRVPAKYRDYTAYSFVDELTFQIASSAKIDAQYGAATGFVL